MGRRRGVELPAEIADEVALAFREHGFHGSHHSLQGRRHYLSFQHAHVFDKKVHGDQAVDRLVLRVQMTRPADQALGLAPFLDVEKVLAVFGLKDFVQHLDIAPDGLFVQGFAGGAVLFEDPLQVSPGPAGREVHQKLRYPPGRGVGRFPVRRLRLGGGFLAGTLLGGLLFAPGFLWHLHSPWLLASDYCKLPDSMSIPTLAPFHISRCRCRVRPYARNSKEVRPWACTLFVRTAKRKRWSG